MGTVLFIILPYKSHYNACQGIIEALQRQGYRVIVTSTPTLADHVSKLNVEQVDMQFIEIPYMHYAQFQNVRTWFAIWIQSHLNRSFSRKRYKKFMFSIHASKKIVENIKPAHIYIDSTVSHYYFILSEYKHCITLLNTRLSTRFLDGIPPYTKIRIPKDTLLSRILVNVEWGIYLLKMQIQRYCRQLALGSLSDEFILNRINKKRGNKQSIRWYNTNMNYPLPVGAKEWILCPKVFEYPWAKAKSNERYVWFSPGNYNLDLPDPLIKWLKNVDHHEQVVYCSLGTFSSHMPSVTLPFLNLVMRAISTLSNIKLILAVGDLFDTLSKNTFNNIYLIKYVAQTSILPHCSAMITHGGMNTVKECICAGIPMLVYPLNTQVEQPGNAARIVYHNLGIAGDINHETESGFKQKLLNLLQTATYKQRIQYMRQRFQEANSFSLMDLAESK